MNRKDYRIIDVHVRYSMAYSGPTLEHRLQLLPEVCRQLVKERTAYLKSLPRNVYARRAPRRGHDRQVSIIIVARRTGYYTVQDVEGFKPTLESETYDIIESFDTKRVAWETARRRAARYATLKVATRVVFLTEAQNLALMGIS